MDEDRRDWRLEVREGIMQHFNSQGHQKPLLRISKANSGVTFLYFDIIMFDFHVKASEFFLSKELLKNVVHVLTTCQK